jgi:hypothetical protein
MALERLEPAAPVEEALEDRAMWIMRWPVLQILVEVAVVAEEIPRLNKTVKLAVQASSSLVTLVLKEEPAVQ